MDFPSALLKLGKTLVLCDQHGWTEIQRAVSFREHIERDMGITIPPLPDEPLF